MSLSSDLCGVQAHDRGDHTVIRFTGPRVLLDEDNIARVGEQLLALAGRLKPGWLLVDFGNVSYLTTTALGLLLRLRQALCGWGGRLTLRHLHPRLYEVFEVTKLHTLFDIQSEAAGSGSGVGMGPAAC
jgi:anti-anti-sigma factor